MARVHTVKSAQASKKPRQCRRCGYKIKVGDTYYYFTNRMGRVSVLKIFCCAHYPKASEKTTSDKLSQLYAAQEGYSESAGSLGSLEDIAAAVRDVAAVAESVGTEYQESLDNMPESLQESSGIQEKIEACESWQSELESAADEIESMELPTEPEEGQEIDPEELTLEGTLEQAVDVGQIAVDSLEL